MERTRTTRRTMATSTSTWPVAAPGYPGARLPVRSSATTTLTAVIGGVALEVRVGDLLDEVDADALVNAANAALRPGGGVCGALHTAAGSGLAEECAAHVALDGPVAVGGAAITTGGDLPVPWLIHAVGPIRGVDDPALLEAAYRSALALAEAAELATVAFPLLAAGIYGCPPAEALARALRGLRDHLADGHPTTLRAVRLILRDPAHWPIACAAFAQAFPVAAG